MSFRIPSLKPPKPEDVAGRRLRLIGGRGGAEVAAIATSFGALHFAEKLTPQKLEGLKAFVAKRIVMPHLSSFDNLADKMPGFEGKDGVAARQAMTPEERVKYYADGLVDYSIMIGGSFAGQTAAQWLLDHMLGLHLSGTGWQNTRKMALATTADGSLHLGAMLVLTAGMPGVSEKMQHFIAQHVLKHVGITDDKAAEEKARAFVTLNVPSLAGWVGSLWFLDKVHAKELSHPPIK